MVPFRHWLSYAFSAAGVPRAAFAAVVVVAIAAASAVGGTVFSGDEEPAPTPVAIDAAGLSKGPRVLAREAVRSTAAAAAPITSVRNRSRAVRRARPQPPAESPVLAAPVRQSPAAEPLPSAPAEMPSAPSAPRELPAPELEILGTRPIGSSDEPVPGVGVPTSPQPVKDVVEQTQETLQQTGETVQRLPRDVGDTTEGLVDGLLGAR